MRRRLTAVACACAAVACPGLVAASARADATASPKADAAAIAAAVLPLRPLGAAGPLANERLSDERRLTRYAHAVARVPIRQHPTSAAPRIGDLRYETEDGPLEVYPVLESRVDGRKRPWLRVRIPARPNGRTGWVRRSALGSLRSVTTHLRVDRQTLRAVLSRDGRRIWSSPIGVGASRTPTPAGSFWIRTRIRLLAGGTRYGPWAFGTGAYSVLSDWPGGGVIGIHGTDQPELIPGRPSHGCVRVPNRAIRELARLMPVGTPVDIR